MLLETVLLFWTFQATQAESLQCGVVTTDTRIVGGEDTGGLHYPWFALLRLRTTGDPPVCAGSLISPNHVLTAAHCFTIMPNRPNEELFTVAMGVYDRCATAEATREVFTMQRVVVHESYTASGKFYDIALITLDRATAVPPVCLPPKDPVTDPQAGLLVGFGVTQQGDKNLPCHQRQARVTRYTQQQCADTRLPEEDSHEPTVFCGGGKGIDSCQGDSGGPFLTEAGAGRYAVSGIVSYGYGCGKDGLPGIYTNVASYLDWIADKMKQTASGSKGPKQEIPPLTKSIGPSVPAFEQGKTDLPNVRTTADLFNREPITPHSNPVIFPGTNRGSVAPLAGEIVFNSQRTFSDVFQREPPNPEIFEKKNTGQVEVPSGRISFNSQQPLGDQFHRELLTTGNPVITNGNRNGPVTVTGDVFHREVVTNSDPVIFQGRSHG